MKYEQTRTVRQSMAWMHTWAGLLLGWLMYAIFVTGSLSFFRNEITHWMQPEEHGAGHGAALDQALAVLQRDAPHARQWMINLPGERNASLQLGWRDSVEAARGGPPPGEASAETPAPERRAATGERPRREDGAPDMPRRGMDDGGTRSGWGARDGSPPARAGGDTGEARPGREQWAQRDAGAPPREGMGNDHARAGQSMRGMRGEGAPGAPADARGEQPAGPEAASREHAGPPGEAGKAPERGHGGRVRLSTLAPENGALLTARETAGGDFLYRFHYQLYGMGRDLGRWIVGIVTMVMFAVLVSGIIVHRNIFKDFFTFRPGKGKRSWLDAHNASGVLALPFHLVLTFSGLLLLGYTLLPSAVGTAYQGDPRGMMQERMARASPVPELQGQAAPLTDLGPLLATAQQAWPAGGASSIVISNPGDASAQIELMQATPDRLEAGIIGERLLFDGVSGALREHVQPTVSAASSGIWNTLIAIHQGRFAFPAARWLMFLSGLLGAVMAATGLCMWSSSRWPASAPAPFGQRLVSVLNIATIAGLLCALGAYFWGNRLLPGALTGRADWEVRIFFGAWLLCLIHATLRPSRAAWFEQFIISAALALGLPLLDLFTRGKGLLPPDGLIWGFDAAAVACGLGCVLAALHIRSHQGPRARKEASEASARYVAALEKP